MLVVRSCDKKISLWGYKHNNVFLLEEIISCDKVSFSKSCVEMSHIWQSIYETIWLDHMSDQSMFFLYEEKVLPSLSTIDFTMYHEKTA